MPFKKKSPTKLLPEAEKDSLYLEMTREIYLLRKHSLANDGKYMNLSEAISRMMANNTDKYTGHHTKYKIKDEKEVRKIYEKYLPTVFSGLPESFVL
jgi:hypothetical protein